jgi:hypothetical protein
MPIKIEITGESADEVFVHLRALAGTNAGTFSGFTIPNDLTYHDIKPLDVQATLNETRSQTVEDSTLGSISSDDTELDAHGHAWSADLHASTRGKTKEGLWRMKPGAVRPDPKPGFPIEDASMSTESTGETESTPSEAAPIVDAAPTEQAPAEDDEFAAFRAADAKLAEQDAAAVASVPARKFTDADLSAVCNQAAVKLGDPAPVKALIAEFVPEGEIQHSRMIPDAKRADFVAAVEAKAGIEFAG